jgi:hypothetical protein
MDRLISDFAVRAKCVYIWYFEEPLIEVFYRLGLSERKPIAMLEVGDLFDVEDLEPRGPRIIRNF